MRLSVKVTLICLVLGTASGHYGPDYQYFLQPVGEVSEETLQQDAIPSEAVYYQEVRPVSNGPYGIPHHPRLISENAGEVNAREDIPRQSGREARFFHPFDVALASRAIERRVHEALRDFSKKFDLQFPQDHLSLYPSGPKPPNPFKTPLDSFNNPPPPPPLPLPFHPPPFPFHKPYPPATYHPGNPSIPPLPSPPAHPHPPHLRPPMPLPPPGLLPFGPAHPHPPLFPPPLLPFPPKPETPTHPGEDPDTQPPTQRPPTNTTDVWDILLPWWYPAHMRPPTTKPPPSMMPTEAPQTGEVAPANPEVPVTSTPEPGEQVAEAFPTSPSVELVETSTPAPVTEEKETTLEVGNEVEQPGDGGDASVADVTTTTSTASTPSLQSDEQESAGDSLIPLIGEAQGESENESSTTTAEDATTTVKETLLEAASGITTLSSTEKDDSETTTAVADGDGMETTATPSQFDGLIEEIKTIISTANTIIDDTTTVESTTTDSTVPNSNPVQTFLRSGGVFETNDVSS